MKRILITGANSYIGTSFENHVKQWPDKYQINTIDMLDDTWRKKSFSGYDTVFHVAGMVHTKETRGNSLLYYTINRDMAIETAQKAKDAGVKQFVFLSTMNVYGMETGVITKETIPAPKTNYGKSKLQAESIISRLADKDFIVAILRPPMVYGEGCKGNYRTLAKWAKKLPLFPDIKNMRSMVDINILDNYLCKLIDENKSGIFFPQDSDYICTSKMVKEIAEKNNHNIRMTKIFNPLLKIIRLNIVNKVFGDLIYKDLD